MISITSNQQETITPAVGSSGTSEIDTAVFVPTVDEYTPVGGEFDDAAPAVLAEGQGGAFRSSALRELYIQLRDAAGNERGVNVTAGNRAQTAIRANVAGTATILNGANLSQEVDFREYSMMVIHMPAAWTAAFIGFTVSTTTGGTFLPLYDEDGNLVQTATAAVSTAIAAPPELAGCRFVKLWSQDGAGANVAQGGDRVMLLDLKA